MRPSASRASRSDGKTYTFTIRNGLQFSDGSAVTAAAFKRAFERAADPKQASPAIAFMHAVVGADARNEGKAASVTGVNAKGQTLTIRLTQSESDVPRRDRDAVLRGGQAEHGDRLQGHQRLSVGGPVQDRQPRRRPPARARAEHASTRATAPRTRTGSSSRRTPTRTRASSRFGPARSTTTSSASRRLRTTTSRRQYGMMKGGNGRYFVNTGINTTYLALNTSRAALRKGRTCGRRSTTRSTGRRCSEWRESSPASAPIRSCRRTCRASATRSSIRSRAPTRSKGKAARQAARRTRSTVLYTTSSTSVARAQIIKYNLRADRSRA